MEGAGKRSIKSGQVSYEEGMKEFELSSLKRRENPNDGSLRVFKHVKGNCETKRIIYALESINMLKSQPR